MTQRNPKAKGEAILGHLQLSKLIPAPIDDVYGHLKDLKNLKLWVEPTLTVETVDPTANILSEHMILDLTVARFGLGLATSIRVDEMKDDEEITYRQLRGFFKTWTHNQKLTRHAPEVTLLTEIVEYSCRMGLLGALSDDLWVKPSIEKILRSRQDAIESHFQIAGRNLSHRRPAHG